MSVVNADDFNDTDSTVNGDNLSDIEKTNTKITFNINDTYYINETVGVDVYLHDVENNPISGVVHLKLNDIDYNVSVNDGEGKISFSNLSSNQYCINFTYGGNELYKESFNRCVFDVVKLPSILTIDKVENIKTSDNLILNVTLKANEGSICDIYINDKFKQKVYLEIGSSLLNFSYFAEGKYNITIIFPENQYYNSSNATVSFNVSKSNVSFNLSCQNISSGDDEIITIEVSPQNFNSEVILSINGVNNTVFLKEKINKFTISNLTAGLYNVSLIFQGNDRFYKFNSSSSFRVSQSLSNLNVTIKKDNLTGIINVNTNSSNCSGLITLYINNRIYMANLTDGFIHFDVDFDVGTNYIYVFYSGDRFYSSSNFTTVIGEVVNPFLISDDIIVYEFNDFSYDVILCEENGMAMPNKNITIEFLNHKYSVATNNDGIAKLKLNLNKGNYSIKAVYENISKVNNICVENIEFDVNTSNISYLESECIDVSFKRNITGNIIFKLSNNLTNTIKINDTSVCWNISGLDAGNYSVDIFYYNDLFNSSHMIKSFNVNKLNATLDFNISKMNINELGYINLSLPQNMTGNITLIVDSQYFEEKIITNKIDFTLDNLSKGYHNLSIIYSGDNNYNNYILNTSFSVRSIKSDINLIVNDSFFNKDICVVAKLDSNATGNIDFSIGSIEHSAKIDNGCAIWNFTGLNVGNYTIFANYQGDDVFLNSSNQSNFTVKKANSTIELYVLEVYLGENIRIYANLSSNATGYVTYSMKDYYSPRNKTIINSSSNWYISPLEHGQYEVMASYSGDDNYYPSNTSFIFNITQHRSILTVNIDDVTSDEWVIVRVRLTSDNGIGLSENVTLTINDKSYNIALKKGSSSLILGKFLIGNYKFRAVYGGSENYTPSHDEGSFKVTNSILNTVLSANNVVKHFRGSEKLIICLKDVNAKYLSNKNISVKIDGKEYNLITDCDGIALLDLNQKPGIYDAVIKFKGSSHYFGCEFNASVEILSTIQSINLTKLFGSDEYYYAVFTDFDGKALSNVPVTFTLNNKNYTFNTAPNGIARVNINLNIGNYTIFAKNPVTGEVVKNTIHIFNYIGENKDIVCYYGARKLYKVRIFDKNANPVGAGADVVFAVGGKNYHVKTDKNGYASYKINLKPKYYTITVRYGNSAVKNKIIGKSVLYAQNLIVKKGYAFKFKAKLVNSKGKSINGKKIIFKFKNKKYIAKTNKKGYASIIIKLKLNKGKYKIKSKYSSSTITNYIKVI